MDRIPFFSRVIVKRKKPSSNKLLGKSETDCLEADYTLISVGNKTEEFLKEYVGKKVSIKGDGIKLDEIDGEEYFLIPQEALLTT